MAEHQGEPAQHGSEKPSLTVFLLGVSERQSKFGLEVRMA